MEKFWKAAIAVSGLGAVGAFLFWSLYKNWLTLPIFAGLTPDQTFIVMLVFLGLTFLALLAVLLTYFKVHATPPGSLVSEVSNVKAHQEGSIVLVDATASLETEKPEIDIKVRNPSSNVVFVKRAEVEVLRRWDITSSGNPSALPITASYGVLLSGESGERKTFPISQEVEPARADRFSITIGSTHSPYPFRGLFLYLLQIKLIYNENDSVLELPPVLMHLQTAMEIQGYFDPGPSPALVTQNKATAADVLKSLPASTVLPEGLREAIESWANAPA